jgi:hypothetical protein
MAGSEVTAKQRFAVYLEVSGPGHVAERMRQRFGADAARAAYDEWSGRLTGPDTTREVVITALGPPDECDDRVLRYALPTRAGYVYTFEFACDGNGGHLLSSGFTRRHAPPVEREAGDEAQLATKLAEAGATADEVRALLGLAAREFGWWPIETWEYAEGPTLQLRHGVVESPDEA